MSYSVVWFKRDLRLADHAPLCAAAARGPLLCLYVVEPGLWQQPDASARQYHFLRESLHDLAGQLRERGLRQLVVTDGAAGVYYGDGGPLQHLEAPVVEVRDVTGAGDAFAAGVAAALHQDPQDLTLACRRGLALAVLTLQTETTVHPELGPALLDAPL